MRGKCLKGKTKQQNTVVVSTGLSEIVPSFVALCSAHAMYIVVQIKRQKRQLTCCCSCAPILQHMKCIIPLLQTESELAQRVCQLIAKASIAINFIQKAAVQGVMLHLQQQQQQQWGMPGCRHHHVIAQQSEVSRCKFHSSGSSSSSSSGGCHHHHAVTTSVSTVGPLPHCCHQHQCCSHPTATPSRAHAVRAPLPCCCHQCQHCWHQCQRHSPVTTLLLKCQHDLPIAMLTPPASASVRLPPAFLLLASSCCCRTVTSSISQHCLLQLLKKSLVCMHKKKDDVRN